MSNRWLIYRHGGIGDTILITPLLQVIRAANPSSHITVIGHSERVGLVCGPSLADAGIASDSLPLQALANPEEPLPEELRAYLDSFDRIIWFAGKPGEEMGEKLRVRGDQRVRVMEALPAAGGNEHVVSHSLSAIREWIDESPPCIPMVELSTEETRLANAEVESWGWGHQDDVILGVHVGAGGVAKRTPLDLFFRVLRRPRPGERTLLLVTCGPADHDAVEEFCQSLGSHVSVQVVKERPLRQVAALLSCCTRFVGNDSGITHLAAAVGVPVDVLFVGSDPVVWSPLGDHVRVHDLRSRGQVS